MNFKKLLRNWKKKLNVSIVSKEIEIVCFMTVVI